MGRKLYNYIIPRINENGQKNFFLQAPGGAGKTYQMLALRDDCLDSKDTVSGRKLLPLFVDAKHLSEVEDTPLFSGLIKYFGNDITDGKTVLSFFKKGAESEKYAYLILVDGLNEGNAILREKIFDDLISIEVSNVYAIVSSRADETKYANTETTPNEKKFLERCNVISLETLTVDEHLNKRNIDKNRYDETLLSIIQTPFYMTKFIEIVEADSSAFLNKMVRSGDVLYKYIETLLSVIDNSENKQSSKTKQEQRFVIKYYIPALAFQMATLGKMSISTSEFRKVRNFLSVDFFMTLLNKKLEDDIQIEDHYKNTIIPTANNHIIDLLLNQVALIEMDNNNGEKRYSFRHQILRDMLAAVHLINVMTLSNDFSQLGIYINNNIGQFVGEIFKTKEGLCECDFEKKTECSTTNLSPIEAFMKTNHVILNKNPITNRNLFEIIKTSRNNRITADFSNLDLSKVLFYGLDCRKSLFVDTTIDLRSFDNYLDYKTIDNLSISEDNQLLLVGSKEVEEATIVEIESGSVVENFDYYVKHDYSNTKMPIFVSKDETKETVIIRTIKRNVHGHIQKYFIVLCESPYNCDSTNSDIGEYIDIYISDSNSEGTDIPYYNLSINCDKRVKCFQIEKSIYDISPPLIRIDSFAEKFVVANCKGELNFYDINAKDNSPTYSLLLNSAVTALCFSEDNSLFAVAQANGEVSVWDYSSFRKIQTFQSRFSLCIEEFEVNENKREIDIVATYNSPYINYKISIDEKRIIDEKNVTYSYNDKEEITGVSEGSFFPTKTNGSEYFLFRNKNNGLLLLEDINGEKIYRLGKLLPIRMLNSVFNFDSIKNLFSETDIDILSFNIGKTHQNRLAYSPESDNKSRFNSRIYDIYMSNNISIKTIARCICNELGKDSLTVNRIDHSLLSLSQLKRIADSLFMFHDVIIKKSKGKWILFTTTNNKTLKGISYANFTKNIFTWLVADLNEENNLMMWNSEEDELSSFSVNKKVAELLHGYPLSSSYLNTNQYLYREVIKIHDKKYIAGDFYYENSNNCYLLEVSKREIKIKTIKIINSGVLKSIYFDNGYLVYIVEDRSSLCNDSDANDILHNFEAILSGPIRFRITKINLTSLKEETLELDYSKDSAKRFHNIFNYWPPKFLYKYDENKHDIILLESGKDDI